MFTERVKNAISDTKIFEIQICAISDFRPFSSMHLKCQKYQMSRLV
jgi:hypothetical protein